MHLLVELLDAHCELLRQGVKKIHSVAKVIHVLAVCIPQLIDHVE